MLTRSHKTGRYFLMGEQTPVPISSKGRYPRLKLALCASACPEAVPVFGQMQLKGVPRAKLGWEEDMSGGGQLLLPFFFAPFEKTNTNVKLSHSFFN